MSKTRDKRTGGWSTAHCAVNLCRRYAVGIVVLGIILGSVGCRKKGNPAYCDADAVCASPGAVGGSLCHPTGHFCWDGCAEDEGCSAGWACVKTAGSALGRCEQPVVSDDPDGDDPDGDEPGVDGPGTDPESGLALGARCDASDQCGNGQCTDGVCCGSSDCGSCQRCGEDGTCEPLVEDAEIMVDVGRGCGVVGSGTCGEQCVSGSCVVPNGETVCGESCTADGLFSSARCDGAGACATAAAVAVRCPGNLRCAPGAAAVVAGCTRASCERTSDCMSDSVCDRMSAETGLGFCPDPEVVQVVVAEDKLAEMISASIRGDSSQTHFRIDEIGSQIETYDLPEPSVGRRAKVVLVGNATSGAVEGRVTLAISNLAGTIGLSVNKRTDIYLDRIEISGAKSDGVRLLDTIKEFAPTLYLKESEVSGSGGIGLSAGTNSSVVLEGSEVSGSGGIGLKADTDSTVRVSQSKVIGNAGGGILLVAPVSGSIVVNSVITSNGTDGELNKQVDSTASAFGGISVSDGPLTIVHTTILNNRGKLGFDEDSGKRNIGKPHSLKCADTSVTLYNSVMYRSPDSNGSVEKPSVEVGVGCNITGARNYVQQHITWDDALYPQSYFTVTGSPEYEADPLLNSSGQPQAGSSLIGAEGFSYTETSKALIEGATGGVDIDGNLRVQGPAPDIGAYETTP